MNKTKIEECIRLTDKILTSHFHGDHKLLIEHLHKDCLWIGANAIEYYHGKETICRIVNEEKEEVPEITLTMKHFECIAYERYSCAIAGKYIGVLKDTKDKIFRDMQRVTFLWKEEKGELLIWHMHISNPLTLVKEDEIFPHQMSLHTKEYVNSLIQEDKNSFLKVKGEGNAHQMIPISDIIYMESFDKNSVIHTVNGDILAKSSLTDIEERIAETGVQTIVRVHKSFAVSKYYINSIKKHELVVANKFIVPISRSRYDEVYKKLLYINEGDKENG